MQKLLFLLLLLLSLASRAQDQVKVMTYNILNYGNITSYCTASNNPLAQKEQWLRKIMLHEQPDIVLFNELASNSYVQQRLLDSCFNYQKQDYNKAAYSNAAGSDIVVMAYYNNRKMVLHSQYVLNTNVRDIILYRFYYKDPLLSQSHDTAFIDLIGAHLKAGSSSSDASTRASMTLSVMNWLNSHTTDDQRLFMGDLNLKSSNEQAYKNLLNYSNSTLRFYDPVNKPGNWTNNSSFKAYHTQSTHYSSNGCASGGGLDDRFDIILASNDLMQGNGHYTILPNSYKTIGNDGNHFNSDINYGNNTSAPADIINALYQLSDHLPVCLTLSVDKTGAGIHSTYNPFGLDIKALNPVQKNMLLTLSLSKATPLNIRVFDGAGKEILNTSIKGHAGENSFRSSAKKWKSGIYLLQISDRSGYVLTRKLVKL